MALPNRLRRAWEFGPGGNTLTVMSSSTSAGSSFADLSLARSMATTGIHDQAEYLKPVMIDAKLKVQRFNVSQCGACTNVSP